MFGKAEQIDEDMKPEPHDFYSLSKFLGERAVEYAQRTSKMKCCSLRIRAPYGAGYKIKAVVPIFTENALQGLDIELWGGGLHQQIFTYVRDIAHACEQVIRCGATGTYNITGPGPVTMKELAETIVCAAGADSKIIFNGRSDPNENMKIAISSEAAKKAFGYSPQYDIEAGIVEMIGLIREPPRALHSLQEVKSYG
jgi:nucleoside-diphosphate-sugar epimerase